MAGLTKQHFKKIAEILKRHNCESGFKNPKQDLVIRFSEYLKTQNPLFNENQFKKACLE